MKLLANCTSNAALLNFLCWQICFVFWRHDLYDNQIFLMQLVFRIVKTHYEKPFLYVKYALSGIKPGLKGNASPSQVFACLYLWHFCFQFNFLPIFKIYLNLLVIFEHDVIPNGMFFFQTFSWFILFQSFLWIVCFHQWTL